MVTQPEVVLVVVLEVLVVVTPHQVEELVREISMALSIGPTSPEVVEAMAQGADGFILTLEILWSWKER